jgi:hypothetical protein
VLQIGSLQTTANKTLNVGNPGQAGAWRLVTLQASQEPDSGFCRRRSSIMTKNEKTGSKVGTIASKGMQKPGSLTNTETKTLAASALTQRPDHKKPPKK